MWNVPQMLTGRMFDPWLVCCYLGRYEKVWRHGLTEGHGSLGTCLWRAHLAPGGFFFLSLLPVYCSGHHHEVQPQQSTESRIQNWNSEAMNQNNPSLPLLFQSAFGRTGRSGSSELLLPSVLIWRDGKTVAVATSEKDNISVKRAFAVLQTTHREPSAFPEHEWTWSSESLAQVSLSNTQKPETRCGVTGRVPYLFTLLKRRSWFCPAHPSFLLSVDTEPLS